ncbi:MAG: Porin [uncultured Sulfurovum sp.]|uniref:Porin n=1 Tax=uncultured Sulfurovum sp. TaxID=269237 RepID=A0A6S6SAQ2_9BACT|nr:MAG: Porin [uncultured Sulfurovum sp.]
MTRKVLKIALVLSFFQSILYAEDWEFLSVNGYGTLGVAYQDNENIVFRNSFFTDKGSKGDVSFDNYSVLGLQLDAEATDKLSFTLQAVVSANNANGNMLDVEWANAKYQISDAFDIRVGIMRIPIFIYSDILNVAYSYEMLRLPDMYSLISVNKHQGLQFSYHADMGEYSFLSTLLAGQTDSEYKAIDMHGNISESNIHAESMLGISLKFMYDNLLLNATYMKANIDINNPTMQGVLNQFNTLNIPRISNTIDKYKIENQKVEYLTLGIKYDFLNSYVIGEYIDTNAESFMIDLRSWYVGAGYNFDTWTPYITYAKTKSTSNYSDMSIAGMSTQVSDAIMAANQVFIQMGKPGSENNLETVSVGVRYDLSDNAVLKFQYDEQQRVHTRLDVFSSAINFVF